jgi:hypothetical protein
VARVSIRFSRPSTHPRSLAATDGIAVAFFSCGYLDVSVLHVRSSCPIHSGMGTPCGVGCPIRKSQDQCSVTSSPGLIAGSNVLLRLSTPRHPPCALLIGHTNRTPRVCCPRSLHGNDNASLAPSLRDRPVRFACDDQPTISPVAPVSPGDFFSWHSLHFRCCNWPRLTTGPWEDRKAAADPPDHSTAGSPAMTV